MKLMKKALALFLIAVLVVTLFPKNIALKVQAAEGRVLTQDKLATLKNGGRYTVLGNRDDNTYELNEFLSDGIYAMVLGDRNYYLDSMYSGEDHPQHWPAYCIQPTRPSSNQDHHYSADKADESFSEAWNYLDVNIKNAIGLAIYHGWSGETPSDDMIYLY